VECPVLLVRVGNIFICVDWDLKECNTMQRLPGNVEGVRTNKSVKEARSHG